MYVIRNLDMECSNDLECTSDKACIQGFCSDPCTLRGACGINALCKTVLHRPRCSCPSCFIGRPNIECKPDPKCEPLPIPRPADPQISTSCQQDSDCHESLRCDPNGQCSDPCQNPTYFCELNKKCETRHHRPVCVCKFGFIVNDIGELACAPEIRDCQQDIDCASNMACIENRCKNPCMSGVHNRPACPSNKSCQVQDHKPICICMKDCSPSLSICLRDNGCPADLACRNYQCVNPCDYALCAANSPCFVEDHKPICKFCPAGFVADVKNGCQKGNIFNTCQNQKKNQKPKYS